MHSLRPLLPKWHFTTVGSDHLGWGRTAQLNSKLCEPMAVDVSSWHFSDLTRCPSGVRNTHRSGRRPTTLNLWVHALVGQGRPAPPQRRTWLSRDCLDQWHCHLMALFAMLSKPRDSTSAKAVLYSLDNDVSQRRLLRALLDIDANKLLPAVRRLSTTQTNEILWLLNQIDEGIRQTKQCFSMRHSGWKFSGFRPRARR
jgi:hypothetical protein